MTNRGKYVFFEGIKIALHYSVYIRTSGIRWSGVCPIGFIFSYKIIVRVIYGRM